MDEEELLEDGKLVELGRARRRCGDGRELAGLCDIMSSQVMPRLPSLRFVFSLCLRIYNRRYVRKHEMTMLVKIRDVNQKSIDCACCLDPQRWS